ncbi:MAG: rane protein [Xanthomonadaceae bacterium]|nr:rane protein [Xanthomonadaceae bacterium]
MIGAGALKPLRRPRLWLGLWWTAIALVVVASLVPAFLLPQVPGGGDKVEHFTAYCLLAAAAVQLFLSRKSVVLSGLALIALGVALEIAQGLLTTTRQMDIQDALANTLGVVAGLLTVLTPCAGVLLTFDQRH